MALTVASWNVLADSYVRPEYYPRVEPKWLLAGARWPVLAKRVRALNVDVLCLQEVERPVFEALRGVLPEFSSWFAQKALGKPDGVAVFSKHEGAARTLHYSDGSGHVALVVDVAGVTVATTHFKWAAPDVPAAERWGCRQAGQLAQFLGDASPCILTGDLNAGPRSLELEQLTRAGFVDPHPEHAYTANPSGHLLKIDYVLHRGFAKVTPHAPAPLEVETAVPSDTEPSDHLLISATFG